MPEMCDDKLTKAPAELQKQIDMTIPGMAHFAGTGPPGTICGQCVHWNEFWTEPLNGKRCRKYTQLTNRRGTKAIERHTPSCRHFERDPQRP